MKMALCVWYAVAMVCLCHEIATAQEDKSKSGPVLGAIYKGACYTSVSENERGNWAYLFYADIEKGLPQKTIRFPGNSHEQKQWRIAYDRLWAHSGAPSFGRQNNNVLSLSLDELKQGRIRSKAGDHKDGPFIISFTTGDAPLFHVDLFMGGPMGAKAYYNYGPGSEMAAQCF